MKGSFSERARVGTAINKLISAYASQMGRRTEKKEELYNVLGQVIVENGEKRDVDAGW